MNSAPGSLAAMPALASKSTAAGREGVPLEFAAATFLGAFLVFEVQPLIGKYILPWFGGGPGVWTTCMLFFQTLLVGGYGYAHWSAKRLRARAQAALHVGLLLGALACLPIIPGATWKPVSPEHPTWRILGLLGACLGLPYFVLSATGPLMQEWFHRAKPGVSPYRLYALSNLGSLLALLSYPFFFEPLFARRAQALQWSVGLGTFALVCGFCAWRLWRAGGDSAPLTAGSGTGESAGDRRPSQERRYDVPGRNRFFWVALPACASVLLLAVTNKLCQDVAVIPFLWVLPLGLYLLSFIVCFAGPKGYRRRPFALLLWPTFGAACVALFIGLDYPLPAQVGSYGLALWAGCMVCHGELYRLRPWPAHLTEYYLMIAAGGALGGVFVGLVAPQIFPDYLELPLALCGCPALVGVAYLSQGTFLRLWKWLVPAWGPMLLLMAGLGVALTIQERQSNSGLISSARNFYGVLKVFEFEPTKPRDRVHVLLSGEITHGFQFMHPDLASWPTAYYHEQSGVGLAWEQLPQERPRRVGMVGLGVGTLALYGRANDVLRFYEINDEVLEAALAYFTWLTNCPAHVDVVLGDARLSLEREAPQRYDLLVLDAFNGDAIPVHLLTREAMALYLRHLAPKGVLAAHITNRHVALAPVLARLAEQFHLRMAIINYEKQKKTWWRYSTSWMLLTREPAMLEGEALRAAALPRSNKFVKTDLWTDDHTSLLKVIRWGGR